MATSEQSRIIRARQSAGLSQSELARRAGISRQAIGAIEAGIYQPGVEVALALARELGSSVESLFAAPIEHETLETELIAGAARTISRNTRVALARIGGRIIATPQSVSGLRLSSASGVFAGGVRSHARILSLRSREQIESTLLIAGCDPAVSILGDWMTRQHASIELIAIRSSSRGALDALKGNRAHAAGIHLRGSHGDYNVDSARKFLKESDAVLINFARWEIGLAVSKRCGIRSPADLSRRGIRIVNRESGSGARLALDDSMRGAGIEPQKISGYSRELEGHLEVACAIAAGDADAGPTIRLAAEAYDLGFVPIREERYDFVIQRRELNTPPVRTLLDALNSSRFSRELSTLCGYDTTLTGSQIA
ncbi:MAG: substrate-binding domain-containing protein [Candidatus Binatus sp.]|uniref:substrate-binding domain-containing protein n=1 Tax=Candidatus Binatus sp. TaxID=2811406 RepID=UPI0027233F9D|nr:substrate-binding domain-containing protein [Candidatus Binatus sp.]MDO8433827.1 substrate-binding domain-containing protein [Candidatus Binatus sp.]